MNSFIFKVSFLILFFFAASVVYGQIAVPVPPGAGVASPDLIKFEYKISGLNTATDSSTVVLHFKSKTGVVDAVVDMTDHSLVVTTDSTIYEDDIKEIILFLGKRILYDPKEITKYYH